jgi:hypothetical protein
MKKIINPSAANTGSRVYLYEWNKMTCGYCVTPFKSYWFAHLDSQAVGYCPYKC